jgi:L-lactate utilization protein LutC
LGFGLTETNVSVNLDAISDLDFVLQTKAGRYGGGSYLCQLAIVKYIETFSEKFRATVQNSFISMANGEVETVIEEVEENARKARGTTTRAENKQLQYDLIRACADKKLLPIKPQQGINEGILGMTGAKYKKYFGVPEPLNDNLSVKQVQAKNVGMVLATRAIDDSADATISQEAGVEIGRLAALKARVLLDSSSINFKLEKLALKLKEQDALNLKKIEMAYHLKKRSH